MSDYLDPAASVIRKLGGAIETSKIAGVSHTRVYRWRLPKERDGTGGTIPHEHWSVLLKAAVERGIDLTVNDLLPLDVQPGRLEQADVR
jgi:hypothetical protein